MICFCKNEMKKIIINKKSYYQCLNCNYLKKIDVVSLEEEKKRYDLHICDDGYNKYMKSVFDIIKGLLNKGLSLDYGCGKIHLLSDILNDNGYDCDYYDLFYYPSLEFGMYDNIILIEVFEHIENIFELLLKLKGILKRNGKVIIMTQTIPKNIDNWWYLRDSTHISFVDNKTMEVLCDLVGFKLEYIKDSSIFLLQLI